MKIRHKRLMFARAFIVCICLPVFCPPVASSESSWEPEPADKNDTDTRRDKEKVDVQHEDILDRAFAPLDNAVSDINRDLNKGSDSAASGSSE